MLKKTPLNEIHKNLGASMVDFGGWEMPVQYSNVIEEHNNTRNKAGIFDICHMGEFEVSGENALKFLESVMTNDISSIKENQAKYSVMCNENGGCVDDLFVYRLKDKFMLVVNASNIEKDFKWLNSHIISGVNIKDISDSTAKIDVQGPLSEEILQKLTYEDLSLINRFYSKDILIDETKVLISRTGYTGEDGFELYFDSGKAETIWNKILESGKDEGIKPIGLGARDTLRVESCYSLYGHEINEEITPLEAGIGFVVRFSKENFIGKEALLNQKNLGENHHHNLHCFEMIDRAVPREGYNVLFDGEKIGNVTSGTFSPFFKKGIGMAIIKPLHEGTEVEIEVRNRMYKAKIVKRPFYNFNGKS